jgi:hypothetical protein
LPKKLLTFVGIVDEEHDKDVTSKYIIKKLNCLQKEIIGGGYTLESIKKLLLINDKRALDTINSTTRVIGQQLTEHIQVHANDVQYMGDKLDKCTISTTYLRDKLYGDDENGGEIYQPSKINYNCFTDL